MIIEDIKYNDIKGLDCCEKPLSSVANYLGADFELAFSNAWEFTFESKDDYSNRRLADFISLGDGNTLANLEKYHAVVTGWNNTRDTTKLLEIIGSELSEGRPVIIRVDLFWCTWYKNSYGQKHGEHYCLVVGINHERDELICRDILRSEKLILPMSDFKAGVDCCVTLRLKEDANQIRKDWREIIQSSISRLYDTSENVNKFDEMRTFADKIEDSLDMDKEAEGFEDTAGIPLFSILYELSNSRLKFCVTLKYLARVNNLSVLEVEADRLTKAGNKWNTVKGMLLRLMYTEDKNAYKKRIGRKVRELADLEESIAVSLLGLTKSNNHKLESKLDKEDTEKESNKDFKAEFAYVDLSGVMNSKAFGNSLLEESNANFDGVRSFFLTENTPTSEIWELNGVKFKIADLRNAQYDNLLCEKQVVRVEEGSYSNLTVLASAEFGSYSETMIIEYEDGDKQEVLLEISDWFDMPNFGEKIAWTGNASIRSNINDEPYLANSVNLYTQSHNLKKGKSIKAIQLPECPNVHVFAISLSR